MTDEELAELRETTKAAKAEAKAAREAAARASADHANLQAAYQNDMRIVGQKLFAEPVAQQQAAPEEEELTIDRVRQEIARGVQQGIQQPAAAIGQNLALQNRQFAAMTIPDFNRYAPEIDDLVARAVQANPQAATNPRLYADAFDVVRLQHQDEIVSERVKKRLADLGVEDDEEEEAAPAESEADSSSTPSTRTEGTRKARFSEPLVTPGSAGPRTAMTERRSKARFANDDEAYVSQQFGLAPGDVEKYSNPNYTEDVLGMKGRKSV